MDEHLHWDDVTGDLVQLGCLPDEALVVLVIRFDVNHNRLDPKKRIRFVEKLTEFFGTLNHKNHCLLSLESETSGTHSAFISGIGNVNEHRRDPRDVSISWSLGCAAEKLDLGILDSVEKAAQNGTLARVSGYDVIEWRVENRKPLTTHMKQLQRIKRYKTV